jgi:myo-inositol-1(or 4)-monophosphatase
MPPPDARATLDFLRVLTAEVGGQMAAMASTLRVATSKGGVDVVTKADRFSEDALTAALAKRFPDHRIAAEEGTRLGPPDSPWVWHIDPLDGTCNYSRGIPNWALSVGLAHGDDPVLGVVHAPVYGVTILGAVGLGAWSGDTPLAPATAVGDPREWVVATDWPWQVAERRRITRFLERLAPRIRQYKTLGSAAVDFINLAIGRVDAYCITSIFPWDQCGGAAVLKALAFEIRTWTGAPWDLRSGDIAACRPGMWPILSEAVGAQPGSA